LVPSDHGTPGSTSVTLDHTARPNDLDPWFHKVNERNPWFFEYWERAHGCTFDDNNDNNDEKRSDNDDRHRNSSRVLTYKVCLLLLFLIPRSHDEANVKQTSSKHRAIKVQIVHVYIEYICLMFAGSLLDRVNSVLLAQDALSLNSVKEPAVILIPPTAG